MNFQELVRGIEEAKAHIDSLGADHRQELRQGFDMAEREAALVADGGPH